jgi:hypothetical protein
MAMPRLTVTAEYQPYISTLGDSTLPQTNRTGKGYSRYAPSVVTMLTQTPAGGVVMPPDARHAWITIANYPIRARTDGVDPTPTEGLLIPANTMIEVENQRQFLEQFRFVDTAAGASEVDCMFFV